MVKALGGKCTKNYKGELGNVLQTEIYLHHNLKYFGRLVLSEEYEFLKLRVDESSEKNAILYMISNFL